MFRFPDTVIAAGGSLGDPIGDETTSQCTACNTEEGSDRGGASLSEGHEVGWLREENRFLDIRSDDPSEEVAVDEDGPENGGNSNQRERSEKNLRECGDGLRRCMELEHLGKSHALVAMDVSGVGVDRIVGDGVEVPGGIDEVVALVIGFGEEEDGGDEIDTSSDCAQPPEPLERELLTDPAVDDGTKG